MDRHPRHSTNLPLVQGSTSRVDFPNPSADNNSPASGPSMDAVLGPVPSHLEVESAIASLQGFMTQMSQLKQQRASSNGHTRVEEAFQLLQSDPAIQKLVAALATDKAVWDAVKKNEMVHRLRDHRPEAAVESFRLRSCEKEAAATELEEAQHLVRWIMDIASRITDLIHKWQCLMHVLTHPLGKGSYDGGTPHSADQLLTDQRIGSPLLLAVVTLLIVVVARAQGAHCW
ncbi:unnamed protein product [Linum tenue]|uniref:Uncharacterized protein n=1 Tax=Linum tenue TaxID=586396 RepID=A0AAV0J7S5_9ROSI|nr:unnamed protein product [Linum tenue]